MCKWLARYRPQQSEEAAAPTPDCKQSEHLLAHDSASALLSRLGLHTCCLGLACTHAAITHSSPWLPAPLPASDHAGCGVCWRRASSCCSQAAPLWPWAGGVARCASSGALQRHGGWPPRGWRLERSSTPAMQMRRHSGAIPLLAVAPCMYCHC